MNPPPGHGESQPPLEEFLRTLYPRATHGLLELRALPGAARIFVRPHAYPAIRRFVRQHQDKNIFFGIATRVEPGDGSLANCHDLWALWGDIDFSNLSEVEARRRLAERSP